MPDKKPLLQPTGATRRFPLRAVAASVAVRLALFGLLWLALAQHRPADLIVGAVVVIAAVGLSFRFHTPAADWPLGPRALTLVPWFLWESVTAGLDVAGRALRPGINIDPASFRYRLHHKQGPVPVALAYMISALPGTLVTDSGDDWIDVYTIDPENNGAAAVERFERRIARALTPAHMREPGS